MPLAETVETYKYFIMEAEKLDLAYIVLVRYSRAGDVEFDGRCLSNYFATMRALIVSKANYEGQSTTS